MVRSHPSRCTDMASLHENFEPEIRQLNPRSIPDPAPKSTHRALGTLHIIFETLRIIGSPSTNCRTVTQSQLPRLYRRQRRLLALLVALGGDVGNRDFQKLLFLYCQDLAASDSTEASGGLYQFIPYQYGAFSFTSYADRRRLVERNILAEHDRRWILTDLGRRIIRDDELSLPAVFAQRYRDLQGNCLIAKTYRDFPYYATRSVIAAKVLHDDYDTLRRIDIVRPKNREPSIFTIGYQNRSLEDFLNALLRASVTLLCDVRRNAISRKYGFSKSTLTRACDGVGIRYEHLPNLGIASNLRRRVKSETDLANLFRTYKNNVMPESSVVLRLIHSWLESGESVALMCYERDPHHCHRHCVADALCENTPLPNSPQMPTQQRPISRPAVVTHL